MAYEIADLDGSVEAPSSDYPWGSIKNKPAGTRVNRKMLTDMVQFFQQAMSVCAITPNGLPDNVTNGYQYMRAIQLMMNAFASPIIRNMFGSDYNSSKVYILTGAANPTQNGIAFYNGEIYAIAGHGGPACGAGLVSTLALSTTVNAFGLRVLVSGCGASGSGVADFADVIYFSKWRSAGTTGANFGAGLGGYVTVDNADVEYAKYLITGNTCKFQLRVRNATVTSAPAYVSVTLPFITTNIANNWGLLSGGVYTDGFANRNACAIELVAGIPPTLRLYSLAGFTAGTDDQSFDINVEFEIT